MSETMSSPSDWGQFYHQQNLPTQMVPPGRTMFSDGFSDATVVTTAAIVPNTTQVVSGNSNSSSGHLSPEGRVNKPVRRRSRASRRTPTTLLNTDTTNFRAMVQQFTGGPSAPFASSESQLSAPSFSFGLNAPRQAGHVNNPSAVMVPAGHAGYHHIQYQHQQYGQQQPSYMFSLGNNSPGHGDLFFQRLPNPRPAAVMDISEGLGMEGVSTTQVVPLPPYPSSSSRPPSSSSNENRNNNFLF